MSVVELHPKPELAYFRCDCGCMTFYVRNDEELECALCGTLCQGVGFWKIPDCDDPPRAKQEGDPPTRYRVDSGDPHIAFADTLRFAKPEATAFVAVALKNGTVRAWGNDFSTREQRGWLRRKLEVVRTLLTDAS